MGEGVKCIRLESTATSCSKTNQDSLNKSHWNYTFDKLFVWGLTQFEKIVFLDCDLLIIRNIDHLFQNETFSAVLADSSYPGNGYWRENSGVMVLVPDKEIEKKMLQSIAVVAEDFQRHNKAVGDQDVIQYVLPRLDNFKVKHLDEGYNIFAEHLAYYRKHLGYSLKPGLERSISVVHFVGKCKPWMKKSLKEYVRLAKMCLANPDYIIAYRLYRKFFK